MCISLYKFIETNLKDVLFDHCQGRYSNLSSSQLLNVMFDHCDLQEASFYDANFKKIQLWILKIIKRAKTKM